MTESREVNRKEPLLQDGYHQMHNNLHSRKTVLHRYYLLFFAPLSPLSLSLLFRFYLLLLFVLLSVRKCRVMNINDSQFIN